jgi:hypothetical protein
VPPYIDVRSVAVAITTGSGAGSATKDAELESTANAALGSADIVEAVAVLMVLFGVVATGVGAGSAMGLRSVVASTTM